MSAPAQAGRIRMMALLWGFFPAQVLRTTAALGIPDLLDPDRSGAAAATATELAGHTGTDPEAMARLMRAAVGLGLAAQDLDGRFSLTADGLLLRTGAPGGLGGLAQLFCGDGPWRAWGELPGSVRDGAPALERITGRSAFDAMAADPAMLAVFTEAMAEGTREIAPAVVAACDLTGVSTLVDVGGGNGTLLAAFLAAHPGLRGVLFEMPGGVGDAVSVLPAGAEVVTGDVFAGVPAGDAHVVKSVLHDWDDERAVAVLAAVRAAMPAHGQLFVVEPTLPDDPAELPGSLTTLMSDLNMLVCTGGRERTAAEFAALLAAAGLRQVDSTPMPPPTRYRVLRAVPVGVPT